MASPVCPWWVGKTRDQLIEEVERLRRELKECGEAYKLEMKQGKIQSDRQRERIEELEFLQSEMLKVADRNGWKVTDNHHIITSNQIRRVWGILSGWNEDYADRVIAAAVRSTLEAAFKELGIVRCEGCGGEGVGDIETSESTGPLGTFEFVCEDCHGHGWIIRPDYNKTSVSMMIEEVE